MGKASAQLANALIKWLRARAHMAVSGFFNDPK
jgi:hypothetical protein